MKGVRGTWSSGRGDDVLWKLNEFIIEPKNLVELVFAANPLISCRDGSERKLCGEQLNEGFLWVVCFRFAFLTDMILFLQFL